MSDVLEFSRPFDVATLDARPMHRRISAEPEECRAIAHRLGLTRLNSLLADLALRYDEHAKCIAITGRLQADLEQSCVVSLRPIAARFDEPVDLHYALAESAESSDSESIDLDGPDPLPLEGLDLGEEMVQLLSVSLDPYPRLPDAELPIELQRDIDPRLRALQAMLPERGGEKS